MFDMGMSDFDNTDMGSPMDDSESTEA